MIPMDINSGPSSFVSNGGIMSNYLGTQKDMLKNGIIFNPNKQGNEDEMKKPKKGIQSSSFLIVKI